MENHRSVIVVGAGMSGLAAAKHLAKQGENVLVLEARDRIGGRLHTFQFGDYKIDIGGCWIHGTGPGTRDNADENVGRLNPLYEIAKEK